MNHNEEVPDFLGGLGDMLPADVLKKVNELLEQLHRKNKNHQGSTVFIYAPGSQYVDKQFNLGKTQPEQKSELKIRDSQPPNYKFAGTEREKATMEKKEDIIKNDTPLSALFRKNSHEKLQKVMETWQPFLTGETEDVMKLNEFEFDLSRIQPSTIYLDLAQLINQGGLQCSMSVLAAYMYTHSNLSRSENALYVQLKRYKKLSE
jgi:hypothetical protein